MTPSCTASAAPDSLYEAERRLFSIDAGRPPRFGVCFSGGGNRSAAFSIGVLRALYKRGLLSKVEVISAVSGGSYALSWYLLQSYYGAVSNPDLLASIHSEMMDPTERFQKYLGAHCKPFAALDRATFAMLIGVAAVFTLVFSPMRLATRLLARRPGAMSRLLNAQSVARSYYRRGVQRTYQIVPDQNGKAVKQPRPPVAEYAANLLLSEASAVTFPMMRDFAQQRLPAFVFNTTVRPPHAAEPLGDRIFEIGPVGFGSNSCGFTDWAATEGKGWDSGINAVLGQEPSPFATIRSLNAAPAISGAAISDAALEQRWKQWALNVSNFGLEYFVPDPADESRTLCLSDGGHSENLGAYALLRRRCTTILIVDAEFEPAAASEPTPSYVFEGYTRLKRAAKRELDAEISVPAIDKKTFSPANPILNGLVRYKDESRGEVCYLKLSIDRASLKDRSAIIQSYAAGHGAFPQETTADQYYSPERFQAYSALGYELALKLPEHLGETKA